MLGTATTFNSLSPSSGLRHVERTEAEQLKILLRRIRHETHISKQGGPSTDEGIESDEGDDDATESDGESEDEEAREQEEESFDPIPRTPEDSGDDGNNEEDQGLRIGEEERIREKEEADELYHDVDINQGRGLQDYRVPKDLFNLFEVLDHRTCLISSTYKGSKSNIRSTGYYIHELLGIMDFHKLLLPVQLSAADEDLVLLLEITADVFTEDANQKFLRSLPSSWSQVSLIMRTKPRVDTLNFDDLYSNLIVFESNVKGFTGSSSSIQNVAFVSSDNTSSTNEINTAYVVSTGPQLDHKDLEQVDNGVDCIGHAEDETEDYALMAFNSNNSGSDIEMSAKDKSRLGYGSQIHDGVLSYENEVFASVFDSRSSDVEDSHVNDRFAKVGRMHVVPPYMTGNYMPPKFDFGIDESKFTYGPKQSIFSESDAQTSDLDSCDSSSSKETLETVPKPVESKPKVVNEPKLWSDAHIIEEYDLDGDD
nr:ribonuclease H-like domain-containing protein [Tanacetum cinerariifolium]